MPNRYKLLVLFLCGNLFAQQPNFEWGHKIGGDSIDFVNAVAADFFGNSYAGGVYSSPTVVFGSITLTDTTLPYGDAFIVKYDSDGEALWAKNMYGSFTQRVEAVSCDAEGNVYVAGGFKSDAITIGGTILDNAGPMYTEDIFLVKYDPSGNILWAKSFGGNGHDIPVSMDVTSEGNIILSGTFAADLSFGSTTLTTAGLDDIFYTLLDHQGNIVWAKSAGGTAVDVVDLVRADGDGGFYTCGVFLSSQMNFDPNVLASMGQSDIFLARYDADGNATWCKNYGGTGSDGNPGITVDQASGDVWISSKSSSNNCAIGNMVLLAPKLFLARVDSMGATVMAKSMIAATANDFIAINSMAIDVNKNIYVSGNSNGTFDFEGVTLSHPEIQEAHFLLKYNPEATIQWGRITGTMNSPNSNFMASNGTADVFLGGTFISPNLSFDNVTITNSAAGQDGFLVKVNNPQLGDDDFGIADKGIYPNPVSEALFLDHLAGTEKFRIADMCGRIVHQGIIQENQGLDVGSLSQGVYLLCVGKHTFRFVKK